MRVKSAMVITSVQSWWGYPYPLANKKLPFRRIDDALERSIDTSSARPDSTVVNYSLVLIGSEQRA